jgi:hypothetical protein
MTSVQTMLGGGGPSGSTAAAQVAEIGAKALQVLRKTISVDVHARGTARHLLPGTAQRQPCRWDAGRVSFRRVPLGNPG